MSTRHYIAAAALCLLAGACDLDLERMISQPRYETYERADPLPGGTIMQAPPAGTVPRGRELLPEPVRTGVGEEGLLEEVPIEVDEQLLRRGRNRFEIFCAACHGRLANGVSQVAENMWLVEPPNLLVPPIREYPPGQVYIVVRHGFGLMPSYQEKLEVRERWAVVAYLEALQLSQAIALEELSPQMRREAEPWLKK